MSGLNLWFAGGMAEKRDQRKNPGIRDVDRVTWGNLRRGLRAHLGVRVFVYLDTEQNAINTMYKRIPVKKLTGDEQFKNAGGREFSVLEFWQYGFSNLNSNVIRGALAEFLIENALKNKAGISIRNPWGDHDVTTKDGKKIEVKCASYLQDWDQKELSRIVWTGLKAKKLYWSSAVNKEALDSKADYKSDIYILALLKHQDPATLNILDMNQWHFYVLSKEQVKKLAGGDNSISLSRLQKHDIQPDAFDSIKPKVEDAGLP